MQRKYHLTTDIDISQDAINKKIADYLTILKRDQSLIDEFRNGGYCGGYTALALYAMYLEVAHPLPARERQKIQRDDWKWMRSVLMRLASWDGSSTSLLKKTKSGKKFRRDTERLISLIRQFQEPEKLETVTQMQPQRFLHDAHGTTCVQEYKIGGIFKHEDFAKNISLKDSNGCVRTTSLADELIREHRQIYIASLDHFVGVIRHEDHYFFYDSNETYGWLLYTADQTGELSKAVFEAFFQSEWDLAMPLSINVLASKTLTRVTYPTQASLLEAAGADKRMSAEDKYHTSALYMAADIGCRNSVRFYLRHAPESQKNYVSKVCLDQRAPLHVAVDEGAVGVVHDLLKAGADVNVVNVHRQTALYLAVKCENLQLVSDLLQQNAKVYLKAGNGETALHLAVEKGNVNIVRLLLSSHAPVNAKNASKQTPFMIAAHQRNAEIMALLLDVRTLQLSEEELKALNEAVQSNPDNTKLQACKDKAFILFMVLQIKNRIRENFPREKHRQQVARNKLDTLKMEVEAERLDPRSAIIRLLGGMYNDIKGPSNTSVFSFWNHPTGLRGLLDAAARVLNIKISVPEVENYSPGRSGKKSGIQLTG